MPILVLISNHDDLHDSITADQYDGSSSSGGGVGGGCDCDAFVGDEHGLGGDDL